MILMQNTWGYFIPLTTNLDLTAATVIRVRLVPPGGGTPLDKHLTHSDVTTGGIGLVALPIDEGDLSVSGFWAIEAYDESPGHVIASSTGIFEVIPTLG